MTLACTRCHDVIDCTPVGERWCKCGLTYVRREDKFGGFAFGGPGRPIPKESKEDRP